MGFIIKLYTATSKYEVLEENLGYFQPCITSLLDISHPGQFSLQSTENSHPDTSNLALHYPTRNFPPYTHFFYTFSTKFVTIFLLTCYFFSFVNET